MLEYHGDGDAVNVADTADVGRHAASGNAAVVSICDGRSQFHQLLASSADAVVATDQGDQIAYWNESAESLFGWTAAEAIGRNLADLLIPPAHHAGYRAGCERILAGALPNDRLELGVRCKNGRLLPVEFSVWSIQLNGRRLIGAFVRDISARRLAESDLRSSEQRLRELIDNVSVGILVVQDGRFVFANPHIEHLSGRGIEQLRTMPFIDVVHSDDRAGVLEYRARRTRGEYVESHYAFRICRPYGDTLWVELSSVTIEWEGRAATLSFITDITERKRLSDSHQQGLAERETILQTSIVGIAFLNPEGRVHWANRAVMQMFRGQEINYAGHSLEQYYLSRESYLQTGAAVKEAITAGQVFETELLMQRSDGCRFWAYLSGRAVRTGDLSLGTVWVIMDITARKQLEEHLRISKEQYQSVVDNVTAGMTVAQDGKFIFANPAFLALVGYSNEEIIGMDIAATVHPDDLPTVLDNRRRRMNGEEHEARYDFRVLHKNGRPIWVQISVVVVAWHGRPATLAFLSDISERKQAEEDIRKSLEKQRELNLMKSRFVAMTSHEFRTPLATILSSAELLKYYGDKMDAREQVEVIDSIEVAVKRMTRMLDDVLLIGKVEAGKLDFQPRALELPAFCAAIVAEARAVAATQSGPAVEVELHMSGSNMSEPAGALMLDEKLMRHILGNLLSNAFKYSPQGGAVRFDVACGEQELLFRVADQGIGMPKEDLPKLFESFYRASNVGNISGTGLGLAIVRHSVTLHGGRITVDSVLGAGTTFEVSIPRVNPPGPVLAR